MPVLQVTNLTKTFKARAWPWQPARCYTAVDGISFQLQKGEILGFLGPNGAGKTTTIQMLLGTLTQSSGTIEYFGTDFSRHRIAALRQIGYASGYDKLPGRLTVRENLEIIGRIYGLSQTMRTENVSHMLQTFGLWELRERQTGQLSAGQGTRVMLAKAFLANPAIVLLDEPTASLDPDIAQEVRQFILAQRQEHGTAILITSHNMSEVTELCDRVLVLQKGQIIADNTPEKLAQSIAKVHVHLAITSDLNQVISYLEQTNLNYTTDITATNPSKFSASHNLTVELDEQAIAQFLTDLGTRQIVYNQISIDKPTLEDYFLEIARQNKLAVSK